ncbi:hypothetical protein BGZ83_007663 [Gryganskiella cystojenkinii]|nr:hypothetical protein BGZ83_007663 [Gryganskiella cystojenkinii]
MNRTQSVLHALPSDLINKLCRSKVTRLSLKQMYTLGRHVLESKNQGALVIPAVFLHQELPIRLSHALSMLNSNMLPVNMADMPNFQHIARSYLEDISMVTQMPKPSTPKLEEEFTALLRNLEQRHKIKIMAISRGFRELMDNVQKQCVEQDAPNPLFYHNGKGWTIEPEADKAIQTFFNRFYTINLGTRLLIGEHLSLHCHNHNLVQRVHPLSISKRAIRDAQKVVAAHYGQPAPSVLIHTPNPDISTTYVDEFLHRNIYELLKNAMRATCETHLKAGSPMSIGLSSASSSPARLAKLPPIKLVLVDGGEDVTIKISDEGGGMALSEMDRVWSYVHSGESSSLRQPSITTTQEHPKITTTTTPLQTSAPNTSTLLTSNISETEKAKADPSTSSTSVLQPADSMSVMGGLSGEAKDYLDAPLNGSGHGLPLARLIARYFGGDLNLISMQGYGTDSYLSLYRDDDHLENFPEVDEEMAAEVDVFVSELLEEPSSASSSPRNGENFMTRIIPPTNGTTSSSKQQDENPWDPHHEDDLYNHSDSDLDQDESYYVPSTPFAQKLASLDPALYQGSGGDKENASRIVSALYKVLQQHQKDIEYKEEMDLNWRRLSNDYEISVQNLNNTKAQLEKSERETDLLSGRIGAMEDELRVESEKHRHTRDELKSAKANLQYMKTQFAHESRKKEQEMHILKEKVQKSINRTTNGSTPTSIPGGITVLNPVPRTLYGGRHNTNSETAEQLLQEVIEQQQSKEQELVEENEQLRRTLYTVHVEIEGLLRKHSDTRNSPTNPYGLPYEMVRDKIESEIRDTLTVLSDQWTHRPSKDPVISPGDIVVRDQMIADLQKQIEKLQLELEDSTLLVQGAQKMIDNLSSGNFLAGLQDFKLNLEGSDMTLQEIDEAETKIRQQREELAKERKKFTAACLDLGKQREELQRAKIEFEEGKMTFTLDKFMSLLTSSPAAEKRNFESSPPPSPTHRQRDISSSTAAAPATSSTTATWSRKRVATSPLPPILGQPEGRAVRPKTNLSTTVLEVPDVDGEGARFVPSLSKSAQNNRSNSSEDRFLQPSLTSQSKRTQQRFDEDDEEDEEDEPLVRIPARTKSTTTTATRSGFGGVQIPVPEISVSRTSTPSSFASPGRASRLEGVLGPSTPFSSSTVQRSATQPTFGVPSTSSSSTTTAAAPATYNARPNTPSGFSSTNFVWDPKGPSTSFSNTFNPDRGNTSSNNNDSNSRTTHNTTAAAASVATGFGRELPTVTQVTKMPSAFSRAAAQLASRKSVSRPPSRTEGSLFPTSSFAFTLESRTGGRPSSGNNNTTNSYTAPVVRSTTPSQSPPLLPQSHPEPQQLQHQQNQRPVSSGVARSGSAGTALPSNTSVTTARVPATSAARSQPSKSLPRTTGGKDEAGSGSGSGSRLTQAATTQSGRISSATGKSQQRQAYVPKGPAVGRDLFQSQLHARHLYAANRQTFTSAKKP